jgi:hypothetical protein
MLLQSVILHCNQFNLCCYLFAQTQSCRAGMFIPDPDFFSEERGKAEEGEGENKLVFYFFVAINLTNFETLYGTVLKKI